MSRAAGAPSPSPRSPRRTGGGMETRPPAALSWPRQAWPTLRSASARASAPETRAGDGGLQDHHLGQRPRHPNFSESSRPPIMFPRRLAPQPIPRARPAEAPAGPRLRDGGGQCGAPAGAARPALPRGSGPQGSPARAGAPNHLRAQGHRARRGRDEGARTAAAAYLQPVGARPAPAPAGSRGEVAAGRRRRGPAGQSGLAGS